MKGMKGCLLLLFWLVLGMAAGCTANDAPDPAWKITAPRLLAITTDEPVFAPNDTVSFSAFTAGIAMSERTTAHAEWRFGNVLKTMPLEQKCPFPIPHADKLELFFGAETQGSYIKEGYTTVTVFLTVRLPGGETLKGRKDVLLVTPARKSSLKYRNPVIERLLVAVPGTAGLSLEPGAPVLLPAGTSTSRIGFSVALAANETIAWYRYRWYLEPTTMEEVEIIGDPEASSIEITTPRLAPVTVYLIVEDATEKVRNPLYAGGIGVLSFIASVGSGTPDTDSLLPDGEDTPSEDSDTTLLTD